MRNGRGWRRCCRPSSRRQHAAGAPKKGATLQDAQAREALGRSRGGLTTKLHVRAEGGGKPVAFVVSPGQRHECRYAEALLDQGAVKRPGRGRPRLRPERVAGDKGYSYPHVRRTLRQRGIGAVIPTRKDQRRNPHFDRAAYRTRERVERLINRLKQFRRVATRYESAATTTSPSSPSPPSSCGSQFENRP